MTGKALETSTYLLESSHHRPALMTASFVVQPHPTPSFIMSQPSNIPLGNVSSSADSSRVTVQSTTAQSNESPLTNLYLTQLNKFPAGHPKLASLMGLIPEIAVFRRFGFLNKLNLLHMQAELKYLEDKLIKIQQRDSRSLGIENRYARDSYWLRESDGGDNRQSELLLDIRIKLEKYSMYDLLLPFFLEQILCQIFW